MSSCLLQIKKCLLKSPKVVEESDCNSRHVVTNIDSKHFGKLFIREVEIATHMVGSIIPFRAHQKEIKKSSSQLRSTPPCLSDQGLEMPLCSICSRWISLHCFSQRHAATEKQPVCLEASGNLLLLAVPCGGAEVHIHLLLTETKCLSCPGVEGVL